MAITPDVLGSHDLRSRKRARRALVGWCLAAALSIAAAVFGWRQAGFVGALSGTFIAAAIASMAGFLLGLKRLPLSPAGTARGKVQRGSAWAFIGLMFLSLWLGGWLWGWLWALSGYVLYAIAIWATGRYMSHAARLYTVPREKREVLEREVRLRRAQGLFDAPTPDEALVLDEVLDAAEGHPLASAEIVAYEATRYDLLNLYLALVRDGADMTIGEDFVPASAITNFTLLSFMLGFSEIKDSEKAKAVIAYYKDRRGVPSPSLNPRGDASAPIEFAKSTIELFRQITESSASMPLRRESIKLHSRDFNVDDLLARIAVQTTAGQATHGADRPLEHAMAIGRLLDMVEQSDVTATVIRRHHASRKRLLEIFDALVRHGANKWCGDAYLAAAALVCPETLDFLLIATQLDEYERARQVENFFEGGAFTRDPDARAAPTSGIKAAIGLRSLVSRERYEHAIAFVENEFDQATLDAPDFDNTVNYYAGLAYLAVGRVADAQARLEAAVGHGRYMLGLARNEPLLRRGGMLDYDYARDLIQLGLARLRAADVLGAKEVLKEAQICLREFPFVVRGILPQFAVQLPFLRAVGLDALGAAHEALNEPLKAEPCYRAALHLRASIYGPNDPELAKSYRRLGSLSHHMGRLDKAGELLARACQVFAKAALKGDMEYGLALTARGMLLVELGKHDEATNCFSMFLKDRGSATEWGYEDLVSAELGLARIHLAAGELDAGLDRLRTVVRCIDRLSRDVFLIASERQRLSEMRRAREGIDAFMGLAIQRFADRPTVRAELLETALRYKGMGAEAIIKQRRAIADLGDEKLLRALDRVREVRGAVAKLALKQAFGQAPPQRSRLNQLRAQREQLEKALAKAMTRTGPAITAEKIDIEQISRALPREAVLIEFVVNQYTPEFDLPGQQQNPGPRIAGIVLTAGNDKPELVVDLGPTAAIDTLVDELHRAIARQASGAAVETADELGSRIRQTVFDPIAAGFGGRRRLYIAPDGSLSRLPFEILPLDDGTRLIDGYEISYLASGRDLMGETENVAKKVTAPFVGAAPDFWIKEDASGGVRPLMFKPLHGTAEEGEAVAKLVGVHPVTGRDFVEGAVKACRSPLIFHLATHGFFFSGSGRPEHSAHPGRLATPAHDLDHRQVRPQGLRSGGRRHDQRHVAFGPNFHADEADAHELEGLGDPMLRSGLVLAGANTWVDGGELPAEAEDAILTAEDVATLDTLGTELAVLSACDTGLGQIEVGEGVMGLRRAFSLSGCHSVVLSLWKVSDTCTRDLMIAFYRRLVAGEERAAALREAQQEIRKQHPEPYYWGGFVCQGRTGRIAALAELGALRDEAATLDSCGEPRPVANELGTLQRLIELGTADAAALDFSERLLELLRGWHAPHHEEVLRTQEFLTKLLRGGDTKARERAQELDQARLKVARAHYGDESEPAVSAMQDLAASLSQRHELQRALALQQRVVACLRKQLMEDDPRLVDAVTMLGELLARAGNHDQARELLVPLRSLCEKRFGADDERTAAVCATLGSSELSSKSYDQARDLLDHALRIQAGRLGTDHPDTLGTAMLLGSARLLTRDFDGALKQQKQVYNAYLRLHGAGHPATVFALYMLGRTLFDRGERRPGVEMVERSWESAKDFWQGEASDPLAFVGPGLASLYERSRRGEEALALRRTLCDRIVAHNGENDPSAVEAQLELALVASKWGDRETATDLLESSLSKCEEAFGENDARTLSAASALAELNSVGKPERAIELTRRALEISRCINGPAHETTLSLQCNHAALLISSGSLDEGLKLAMSTVDAEKAHGEMSPGRLHALEITAAGLVQAEMFDTAEPALENLVPRAFKMLGDRSSTSVMALHRLGYVYLRRGRMVEARGIFEQSAALRRRLYGADDERTKSEERNLEVVLERIELIKKKQAEAPTVAPADQA